MEFTYFFTWLYCNFSPKFNRLIFEALLGFLQVEELSGCRSISFAVVYSRVKTKYFAVLLLKKMRHKITQNVQKDL